MMEVLYKLDNGRVLIDYMGRYKLGEYIKYGYSDFVGRTKNGNRIGKKRYSYYISRVVGIEISED